MKISTAFDPHDIVPNTFYQDVSNEEYHSNAEYYSSSILKAAYQSMAKFKYMMDGGKSFKSQALAFGTMAHHYILENETFNQAYAIFDDSQFDGRRKADKALLALFKENHFPRRTIKKSEYDIVVKMQSMINDYPDASTLLKGGFAELSLYVFMNDFPIRVRPDYINFDKGYIIDYKTAKSIKLHDFNRAARFDFNYFLSAALYIDAVKVVTGKTFDYFFMCSEKEEPYPVALYKLSVDSYNKGVDEYKYAMAQIKSARKSKKYLFQDEIQEI